jgi:hypothetical protein
VGARAGAGLGTPLAVCAVLLVLLVGGSAAFGGSSSTAPRRSSEPALRVDPVPVIARRVEQVRRLRFREVPRPVNVSGDQARREGLADLDRSYPAAQRRADEELYKLLGLLRPDDDLRRIAAAVYEGQVAGYYDPRTGRLRVVRGGGAENPVMEETTLAHELNHALEDQRFPLRLDDLGGSGDGALAYTAMVEGTATAVMDEYQRRFFKPSEALGGAAAAAFAAPSTADLPPFITAQLLFPYLGGQAWVNRLYATGSDSWRLIDLAERTRPPVSTEQVMHPEKWLAVEQPARVRVRGVSRVLGRGWKRVVGETFGEWQTREWLRGGGGGGASAAAEGWGGDRVELWQPRREVSCPAPCVERDALVMRWRWDTTLDAAEFRRALDGALVAGMGARPAGSSEWRLRGAAVAAGASRRTVTLAFAPTARLARALSAGR